MDGYRRKGWIVGSRVWKMIGKLWSACPVYANSACVKMDASSPHGNDIRSVKTVGTAEGNTRGTMKTLFLEMGVGYDQHG